MACSISQHARPKADGFISVSFSLIFFKFFIFKKIFLISFLVFHWFNFLVNPSSISLYCLQFLFIYLVFFIDFIIFYSTLTHSLYFLQMASRPSRPCTTPLNWALLFKVGWTTTSSWYTPWRAHLKPNTWSGFPPTTPAAPSIALNSMRTIIPAFMVELTLPLPLEREGGRELLAQAFWLPSSTKMKVRANFENKQTKTKT